MFGIGNIFKKKAAAASITLTKVENKDLFEAALAGVVLVGHASDGFDEKEEAKALRIMENHKSLKHYGSEIETTMHRYSALYEIGRRSAELELFKELSDVSGSMEDKLQVLMLVLDVAESDNNIDEAELKMIERIGKAMGISNVHDYI